MKKLILFVAGLLLFSFVLAKPAQAFFAKGNNQLLFEQAVFQTDDMNLQSFVNETFNALTGTIINKIIGCVSCGPEERTFGMIGTISSLMAFAYSSPPVSGISYLADAGERLNLIQPTYAQEPVGLKKIGGFRTVWTAFRNISYVFFVIIFIIIGFAIMFRVKINPQAVVTIQSALPKIVLGLILITFSYAIVGFMFDITYVVINLVLFTFKELLSPIGLSKLLPEGAVTGDWQLLGVVLWFVFPIFVTIFIVLLILGAVVGTIATLITGGAALVPASIGLGILLLLVLIFFLYLVIRIFWASTMAYVKILISLIFAPFQLLVGIIPGSNATGSWFRNLFSNFATLIIIFTMVFLAGYIAFSALFPTALAKPVLDYATGSGNINEIQAALPDPDVQKSFGQMFLMFFIGLGFLFMAPKAADAVQSFITQKPFEYGTAIGEAMGPAGAVGRPTIGAAGARWYETATAKGGWAARGGEFRRFIAEGVRAASERVSKR